MSLLAIPSAHWLFPVTSKEKVVGGEGRRKTKKKKEKKKEGGHG